MTRPIQAKNDQYIDNFMDTNLSPTKTATTLEKMAQKGRYKFVPSTDSQGRERVDVFNRGGSHLLYMHYNPSQKGFSPRLPRGLIVVRPNKDWRVLPTFCHPLDGNPKTSELCPRPDHKKLEQLVRNLTNKENQLKEATTNLAVLKASLKAYEAFLEKHQDAFASGKTLKIFRLTHSKDFREELKLLPMITLDGRYDQPATYDQAKLFKTDLKYRVQILSIELAQKQQAFQDEQLEKLELETQFEQN